MWTDPHNLNWFTHTNLPFTGDAGWVRYNQPASPSVFRILVVFPANQLNAILRRLFEITLPQIPSSKYPVNNRRTISWEGRSAGQSAGGHLEVRGWRERENKQIKLNHKSGWVCRLETISPQTEILPNHMYSFKDDHRSCLPCASAWLKLISLYVSCPNLKLKDLRWLILVTHWLNPLAYDKRL